MLEERGFLDPPRTVRGESTAGVVVDFEIAPHLQPGAPARAMPPNPIDKRDDRARSAAAIDAFLASVREKKRANASTARVLDAPKTPVIPGVSHSVLDMPPAAPPMLARAAVAEAPPTRSLTLPPARRGRPPIPPARRGRPPKHLIDHERGPRISECRNPAHVHCIACGCPLTLLTGERRTRRPWCAACIEAGRSEVLPTLDELALTSPRAGDDVAEVAIASGVPAPRRRRRARSAAHLGAGGTTRERSRSPTHCPHGVPFARPCRGCARTAPASSSSPAASSPSDVEARHDGARERV